MNRRLAGSRRRGAAGRRPRRRTAGIRIRPAGAGDLPHLAALMARSPLLRRYAATARTTVGALTRARAAGDRLIVATVANRRLVGLAWIVPSRAFAGAAYLRLLLVAEERQRAGVGGALLAAAETTARAVANHLALFATTDNTGARRFYERHGYRHVGDLPGLTRPWLDEALYWKTLRPHGARLSV